jgi:NTF2 fold immunity protein
VTIAEAVLVPVYGKDVVRSERPFHAVLKGNLWIVTGTAPCEGVVMGRRATKLDEDANFPSPAQNRERKRADRAASSGERLRERFAPAGALKFEFPKERGG